MTLIAEWILECYERKVHWLDRRDSRNRPFKLLKFSNLTQALAKAHAYFDTPLAVDFSDEDYALEHTFPDGSTILQLRPARALERAGRILSHCLGLGMHLARLQHGESIFFSYRNRSSKPRATLEISFTEGAPTV